MAALVGEYHSRDAAGKVLSVVERRAPKEFRQRVPKPGGGWSWSLNGAPGVLYRLPELNAADPAEDVYLCEGEKDADRLASLGLVATTIAGGANAPWRPEFSASLKDRAVVILADNDEPGRLCAQARAALLVVGARSVKVLELPDLPEHGDVSDWLDGSATVQSLMSLAHRTPAWPRGTEDPPTANNKADSAAYVRGRRSDAAKGQSATALESLALRSFRIGRSTTGEPFAVKFDGFRKPRETEKPK